MSKPDNCSIIIPDFSGEVSEVSGSISFPHAGTAVLELRSPRPLQLWIGGILVLDEPLFWRRYERQLQAIIVLPVEKGDHMLRAVAGRRPTWPKSLDEHCPSRNRENVRSGLLKSRPDRLDVSGKVFSDISAPAASLRFSPAQCVEDGITWQHIVARRIDSFPVDFPGILSDDPAMSSLWGLSLRTSVSPFEARDVSTDAERARGFRRYLLPVANSLEDIPIARQDGIAEKRLEPECIVVKSVDLILGEGSTLPVMRDWSIDPPPEMSRRTSTVALKMPVFEARGRHAPRREHRDLLWPSEEELLAAVPRPLLPASHEHWRKLYEHAWKMLLRLRRPVGKLTGLPNDYVGTAMKSFFNDIFVWDSSFTAMSAGWGWRAFPCLATLDCLYSRQFDGGYLHRETNINDGLPDGYEPDFSPNPPLLVIAEWKIAALTGDTLRLAKVYPLLMKLHRWIQVNRRLPDGTYWTTGLANGLDNSPSLGDGYPDLTAQMAHAAETLSLIADVLGRTDEHAALERERQETGHAMNSRLWSDTMRFYSTSLPKGGHNPNKVVTGFWPLLTGLVPADRVEDLAGHLLDPKSFWRYHPLPSLSADSPEFVPEGNYWLGSTWAPTNAVTAWGFDRAGRHDLATKLVSRHLDVMGEVFGSTGCIWENYCSEKPERGNWSGPDYSWTALGPISLLLEIVIGLRPDAIRRTLRWIIPEQPGFGAERIPLGPALITLSLLDKRIISVCTDRQFFLEIVHGNATRRKEIQRGDWRLPIDDIPIVQGT
ncbi:MAG: trehalase family glycosidase [Victivallales bacterium]|jgi:hypothetical protein